MIHCCTYSFLGGASALVAMRMFQHVCASPSYTRPPLPLPETILWAKACGASAISAPFLFLYITWGGYVSRCHTRTLHTRCRLALSRTQTRPYVPLGMRGSGFGRGSQKQCLPSRNDGFEKPLAVALRSNFPCGVLNEFYVEHECGLPWGMCPQPLWSCISVSCVPFARNTPNHTRTCCAHSVQTPQQLVQNTTNTSPQTSNTGPDTTKQCEPH